MTAEEWEVTKQILDAAAGLPEAEREAWALRATEKWPSVRGAVLELLPHYRHDPSDACPCAPHVLAPGQLVAGRFHVVRLIAEGGMGEVYEAHDKWLRLRLALKTLRHGQAADGDTLERFKRELLIARGVAHENLCRVYDFVEHRAPGPDGQEVLTPCFTMELLEGETLSDLLSRERPLPLDAVLNIVRQVVSALKLLHERGIIHRDLKPSNIMIVPRTGGPVRAVVTDFGLAKPDAPHELFESAPDFEGAGAPYFMAPELIRKQRPGVASDIYALGLLIDEMVTTSRAYSSRSMTALFFDKLHETPVPPSARSPELPPHWERTILRCIEQEPSARFASAVEVAAALENPGLTALAAPAVGAVAAGRAVPGRRRLKFPRWGWTAAMIALPTVFVMAAWAALARQPVSTSIQISEIENLTAGSDYDSLSDRVRRWLASHNVTSPPAWPMANSTAFDLYMRGQNLLEEVSPPAAAAAIEYFRHAIEEDPSFALAYAALSEATAQLMNYQYRAQSELARQARQYAQKAVELDPSLPEAHAVLASVKQMDWDWKGAEASYREALRLKPGFSRARRSYAGLLAQFGRWDEALSEARTALDQDPLDRSAPPSVGLYLFLAGQYHQAVRLLTKAVAEKDMPMARANLGEVYAWLAHTTTGSQSDDYFLLAIEQAEAIAKFERAISAGGPTTFSDKQYALTYAARGDFESLTSYLRRLEQDMLEGRTSPVTIASIYTLKGQLDKACDLLDRATLARDRRLFYAKVVPFLSRLHGLPRFEALLRHMNMG